MARMARVVAPGYPHHVTQRGNRRQLTFFCEEDYRLYLCLMGEWCAKFSVEIWAYCLMPNHVHLVAAPRDAAGLRRAIGEAHRRYTLRINKREGWHGHLWQERFSSFVMDEPYLLAAVRYVELNPVRACLAAKPGDYPWSSATAHLAGKTAPLAQNCPVKDIVGDWAEYLDAGGSVRQEEVFRERTSTGRPLGGEDFLLKMERRLGRNLHPLKRGPKVADN